MSICSLSEHSYQFTNKKTKSAVVSHQHAYVSCYMLYVHLKRKHMINEYEFWAIVTNIARTLAASSGSSRELQP